MYKNMIKKVVQTMKVYDKEIYNKQESIKTTIIIIVAFLIGFAVGYFATSHGKAGTPVNSSNPIQNSTLVLNK